MSTEIVSPRPLLRDYPGLAAALPWTDLGASPTPITPVDSLGPELTGWDVFVKRDDLLGTGHGGNKVRKLEFLLADALRRHKREVMTFGFAGSNHATATAWYARALGLRSISMLLPQANAVSVQRNLLLSQACGAELHQRPTIGALKRAVYGQLLIHTLRTGRIPMLIPAGGSSPLGICGFVNAALELRDQIRDGLVPEPKRIYIAVGSMGSACGLTLGLLAAGLSIPIEAVRVTPAEMAGQAQFRALFEATARFLHRHDSTFPRLVFADAQFTWRDEFFGEEYGVYSAAGLEAAALSREHAGIPLDGTYSAKAMAAMIHDAQSGERSGGPVLFWATYNSKDVYGEISGADYRVLPKAFHSYFESAVQPLDAAPRGK